MDQYHYMNLPGFRPPAPMNRQHPQQPPPFRPSPQQYLQQQYYVQVPLQPPPPPAPSIPVLPMKSLLRQAYAPLWRLAEDYFTSARRISQATQKSDNEAVWLNYHGRILTGIKCLFAVLSVSCEVILAECRLRRFLLRWR